MTGIDYGMGRTNIDRVTGIRYGVIAQGTVGQAWYDESEPQYGPPCCPKCYAEGIAPLTDLSDAVDASAFEQYGSGCADYACEDCEITVDSADAFPDDPLDHTYSDDEYELATCLDVNVFVLQSPYYTLAPFCSPCVPGAGDLDNAENIVNANGVKTYCLGHDWFEEGKAPYPVYDVVTGALVNPKAD